MSYQKKAFWMKRTHEQKNIFPMPRVRNLGFHILADGEPGAGDPKPGSPDPTHVPAHLLTEAYAARDAAKAEKAEMMTQKAEMEKTLAALKGIVGENPEEFAKELNALRDFRKTSEDKTKSDIEKIQAEMATATNNHKAAIEKLTGEHGTALKTVQDALEAKVGEIAKLRDYQLRSEIYKAAVQGNAANPDQIVLMLTGQFELTDKGEFIHKGTTSKGTPVELSIADHCKAFLEDEANANLLGGSDPRRKTNTPNDKPGSAGNDKPGKGGDGRGGDDDKDKDKKTYVELLGRDVTDSERRRYPGQEDEDIAMALYYEHKTATEQTERNKRYAAEGYLPGSVPYRDK